VDGSIGEAEGEFAVGSEFDDPSVVVDFGVVHVADGEEVVQVGVAAVGPSDYVVEFAAVVANGASGDGAVPVEVAECSALGPAGEGGEGGEGDGLCGEVALFLEGVRRTSVGHLVTEQRLHHGVDT